MSAPYLVMRPITELLAGADPRNPRTIDDGAAARLCHSISAHGYLEPVVFNTRTRQVVGGHQRIEAARAAGYTELPCVEVDLSPEQQTALNIALNAPVGAYDNDKVAAVLRELDVAGMIDDAALPPYFVDEVLGRTQEVVAQASKSRGATIDYAVVFDSEADRKAWLAFTRRLEGVYGALASEGARLCTFLSHPGLETLLGPSEGS